MAGADSWDGSVGADDALTRYELDVTGSASELAVAEIAEGRGSR